MFIEISGVSIKFKRHVYACPPIRVSSARRSASSPFDTASFSPSDPKMPIQILRAIFVAIKYYVFGLMAQKYSILKRGTSLLVSVKRGIKINSGTCGGRKEESEFMVLARTLSRFVWLTPKKRRRSMLRRRDLSFTRFSKRESANVNTICEPKRPLRYLPLLRRCFFFFRRCYSFFLGCVRAIPKSAFVRSRFSSVTRIWKLTKITKLYYIYIYIYIHERSLSKRRS